MNIYYTNSQNPLFLEAFQNRGNWKEYEEGDKKIDFYFRDIKFPNPINFPKVKIKFENFIGKMEGRDKYTLVNSFLKSKHKDMVMNQIKFNPNNITDNVLKFIKKGKIYIAKPVNSCKGLGIIIIPDLKTFNKKRKYFKEYAPENKWYAKKHKQAKYSWVLQEYISNPLLYKGKKIVIRVGYCITNKGESYIYNKFKLSTPMENYKVSDFENRNIHFETDQGAVIVGDDKYKDFFDKKAYKIIKKSIFELHKKLALFLNSKCFEGTESCYNFMGSDIIFTDDYKIKLLELNKGPGAGTEYHREARFAFFDFFKDKIFDKTKTKHPNIIKIK